MEIIKYVNKPCLDAIIKVNNRITTYKYFYGEYKFLEFYYNNIEKWNILKSV